jgi:hypothetical protein
MLASLPSPAAGLANGVGTDRIDFCAGARRSVSNQFVCDLSAGGGPLLTEAEVRRSINMLFKEGRDVDTDAFDKAEALLDELRPESPLRLRLQQELQELRNIHGIA